MCSFIPLLQGEADFSHLRKGLVFRNHLQGDKILGPSRSGLSADGCFSVFQSPQQILKHVKFFVNILLLYVFSLRRLRSLMGLGG